MALTPAQISSIVAAAKKDVPQAQIAKFVGIPEEQVRSIVYSVAAGSTPDAVSKYLNAFGAGAPIEAAAHPGQYYDPGTPTPPVQPFQTGADIINEGAARSNYDDTIRTANDGYGDLVTSTNYGLAEIDRNAPKQFAAVDDSAIGRGIFHSSIRDGDIADVTATNALHRDTLNNNLATAHTRLLEVIGDPANGVVGSAGARLASFLHGMDQTKVDNAQGVNADQAPYLTGKEPGWKTPTAEQTYVYKAANPAPAGPAGPPKFAGPPKMQAPSGSKAVLPKPRDIYRGNTGKRRV